MDQRGRVCGSREAMRVSGRPCGSGLVRELSACITEQGHGDRQRGKLGPLWVLRASEAYNASSC